MRRLAFLWIFALLLAGCGSESTTPSAVADASQLPADQVIYGLQHNMTKDGIRSGTLVSDTAYLFEAGRRLDLKGVELRFYGETGRQTGVLTSETGEYEIRGGSFVARGNVVLVTEDPATGEQRRLETEELHYNVANDLLWSEVPFVLREGGSVTRGQSFRSDASFRTWEVTGAKTEGGIQAGGSELSF